MKLKPCPFCGGSAEMWDTEDVQYPYQIVCMSCFCGTDEKTYKESAIEAWNRREPMDKIVEQLEEKMDEHHNDIPEYGTGAAIAKYAFKEAIGIVKKEGSTNE